ncbi:hypothetical protein ACIBI9_23445 [Nonomuraea sp. NPDC050451]|uniref:hypothetical protein n=1 Tax=Nonomuraea sp. NPDC050451 TaxID=3364364 RepID=UPI0037B83C8B
MTRYAIDHSRNVLIALWGTGMGDIATIVTELPRAHDRWDAQRLAASLTDLSRACWRCYTHPASTAERQGPNSVGWYRQCERDAFAAIVPALTNPGPAIGSPFAMSTTRVEDSAHRIGRSLRAFDISQLTVRIITEVTDEVAAVEQAELGDLSDRAQQAVVLSREDASPLQVAQADGLLQRHPFGPEELFTEVDPAAAAIAAAHWLYAAASTTARRARLHPAQVVARVDGIRSLVQESLTEIVTSIGTGTSPRQAVMPMIRHALRVAEGNLSGVTEARYRITAAEELAERAHSDLPELGLDFDTVCLPISPLDPLRPAPDLLENLLEAIHGCWLLDVHRVHPLGTLVDESAEPLRRGPVEAYLAEVRQEAAVRREDLL